MAAYFVFNTHDETWHCGFKPSFKEKDLANLDHVQIDGDEAGLIYGIGLEFNGKRVHKLSKNESILYAKFILERYKDSKSANWTEEKVNNLLRGDRNAPLN